MLPPPEAFLVLFILMSSFYLLLLEDVMFEGLFQPMHLLVVLFIALLVFGPKKLPELGKGLGDGIRSFRDSMKEKEHGATSMEEGKAPVADASSRG